MALFAIAIKACFFFVSSMATSCVDDEVAMLQGQVHLGSLLHKADAVSVVSLEEAMSVSTAMLEDIDDQLTSLKTHLDKLESRPLWIQANILKRVMGLVPALEDLDNQVVEYGQSVSNLSWDWVKPTFSDSDYKSDSLHKFSKAVHFFSKLPMPKTKVDEGTKMRQDMAKKMTAKMAGVLHVSDTLANGLDKKGADMKWRVGNATLKNMQLLLGKFVDGKHVFDERMKLWNETLTSMAANTHSSADPAEFSEAASQLSDDAVNILESVVKPFEKSFYSVDMSKERYAKEAAEEAANEVADAKKKAKEAVKKTVDDVSNTMETVGKIGKGLNQIGEHFNKHFQDVRKARKTARKSIRAGLFR